MFNIYVIVQEFWKLESFLNNDTLKKLYIFTDIIHTQIINRHLF